MQLRGRHVAMQPGSGKRRSRRRAVAGGLALSGLVSSAVLVSPHVLAQSPAQRVLQAVEIDLGADGTIHGILTTNISKTASDGDVTTTRLDPAEHAAALPVRVLTSWSHDGRVGTDLSEIEGVSGLVRVDITVQNTTVEAQRFQYDAAGLSRDAYELVAVPLTVVASATLPEGSFARVIQSPAGTTSRHASNGVVTTQEDGSTSVQWASLLAPPRLSSSTTFTLVEEAKDFALPDFTLSVQPGLATDASVTRLLGDAFGGSAALVGVENNTIGLIAEINTTLAEATDNLAAVRESLTFNANELGSATVQRLDLAAGDLDAAAASVRADLQALDGSVTAALERSRSAALTSLSASVQGLLDYLGTPGAAAGATQPQPASSPAPGRRCEASAAAVQEEPAGTLLGQLGQVSDTLRVISRESGDCVVAIRTSLSNTIGDGVDCPEALTKESSLVCQLRGTSATLTAVAGGLATEGARILGVFDSKVVGQVETEIEALAQSVQRLQRRAKALTATTSAGSALGDLSAALSELRTAVAAAASAADPVNGGVATALRELHSLALLRGSSVTASAAGLQNQLSSLASQICGGRDQVATQIQALTDLIKGSGKDVDAEALLALQQYADTLRAQVDGQTCPQISATATVGVGGGDTLTSAVAGNAANDAAAWADVAVRTDPASTGSGTGAALVALQSQLGALAASIDSALALVGDPASAPAPTTGSDDDDDDGKGKGGKDGKDGKDGGTTTPGTSGNAEKSSLSTTLASIATQVDALYDAPTGTAGCPTAPPVGPAATGGTALKPLNALQGSFRKLSCNQRTVAKDLEKLLKTNLPAYEAAAASVGGSAEAALAVRGTGDKQLDTLLTALTSQLNTSADRQLQQGEAVVRTQRTRLQAQQEAAARDLDRTSQDAVASLATTIAASITQQAAASEALQDQLQRVLLDLGSAAQGRGLLGAIQDSASQTGVRTEQVSDVSRAASSFRGVRRAALADAQLEQQQVARSLEAAQRFPAFAVDLPKGSTSTTVYIVRMRKVG